MFWIIEAKSPKSVPYPFDLGYLVQGLQYCIHPEIQAKYLVVTNGLVTAVYDAHGSVFLDQDMYAPILEFKASELSQRWTDVYALLSVETLRNRIENDLKTMFDKLCLSSLDENYPQALLRRIGVSTRQHAQEIRRHVARLNVEAMKKSHDAFDAELRKLDPPQLFAIMDFPLRAGKTEAEYFVEKSLAAGKPADEIFAQLTYDFERQSIFRKEQTFVGLCVMHNHKTDPALKAKLRIFFDKHKDSELPLLNQLECCLLRLMRKICIMSIYPELRERLTEQLRSAPEIVRFVQPPTAFNTTYAIELMLHDNLFEQFSAMSVDECEELLRDSLKTEVAIEEGFKSAYKGLSGSENQMCGF